MSVRFIKSIIPLIILTQILFLASISFAQSDDEKLEQVNSAFEEAKVLFDKGTLESFQTSELKIRLAARLFYTEIGSKLKLFTKNAEALTE